LLLGRLVGLEVGLAENLDRAGKINPRGVSTCMKPEPWHMRAHGSGAIVSCSSLGGLVGLPGRATHHAPKHGVIGLTRNASNDRDISVIAVMAVAVASRGSA